MAGTAGTPESRATRIVVVDDERHIVRLLAFLLRSEGYEVAVAYDGEEALAVAEAFVPDGMLLDLRLPKLSGQDVLERLRADNRFAALKVFVLSGCPYDGEPDDPGRARADVRCSKPIAPSTLLRTLREHGLAPSKRSAPSAPSAPQGDAVIGR
jgi:two-component system alkaline phosphatase synthesis response regulator PhoP